jgi:hypothetical protein
MDSCYVKAHEILSDIQSELRTIPSESELIAEMPDMVWPS